MIFSIWARDFYTNTIAIDGKIPWHISSDLKRFKFFTNNSTILVGRKTYETLPNKNLPGRKLIILSSDLDYSVSDPLNHRVTNNLNELNIYKNNFDNNLFVAGGGLVYLKFFEDSVFKPDYVIDCKLKNKEITNKINSFSKERKLVLSSKLDLILKDDYLPIKSFQTKDDFTNTIFLKKDKIIDFLFEASNKNF